MTLAASGPVPRSATLPAREGASVVLFTAFEPSGDLHAAPVIEELKRRRPDLQVYAWGGPRMREAGAEIVEETGSDAVVGGPPIGKILEHLAINRRIDEWLKGRPVGVHVPVDSPSANFPICKISRRHGWRVVHLVAPQLWAWGPWRVRKLRRLTDQVLCLLPFEEVYFQIRNIPARFVGHPAIAERFNLEALHERAGTLPRVSETGLTMAMLPGSRPAELRRHAEPMVRIFARLRREFPDLTGLISAASPEFEGPLNAVVEAFPEARPAIHVISGRFHEIVSAADVVLSGSGTATLHLARFRKPMVVMYKTAALPYYLIGRWLVRPPFFSLPNLVARERIVPEFVPHFGDETPIYEAMRSLIADPSQRHAQIRRLAKTVEKFGAMDPAVEAADAILRMCRRTVRAGPASR